MDAADAEVPDALDADVAAQRGQPDADTSGDGAEAPTPVDEDAGVDRASDAADAAVDTSSDAAIEAPADATNACANGVNEAGTATTPSRSLGCIWMMTNPVLETSGEVSRIPKARAAIS